MSRLSSLAALALAFALVAPASAQESAPDTVALPVDSVAAEAEPTIEPDPERARELYEEGRTALTAKDYEGALAQFNESLLYNESYAVAALGRGQALAQLGRLEDSRSALEAAVAMADASDAANAADVKRTTQRYLDQINAALETRAANAAAQQEAAAAAEAAAEQAKVSEAVGILDAINLGDAEADNFTPAADAYALLEQARMAGYDPDLAAYHYAKALVAMDRGAEAVPFAETAVAQSEGQADRSGAYILLAQAHIGAKNAAEARAALEAIEEGQAWHGWVPFYMGQVDALASDS